MKPDLERLLKAMDGFRQAPNRHEDAMKGSRRGLGILNTSLATMHRSKKRVLAGSEPAVYCPAARRGAGVVPNSGTDPFSDPFSFLTLFLLRSSVDNTDKFVGSAS